MAINRRDFVKLIAGSGLFLATNPVPASASSKTLSPEAVGILYDSTLCIGCKSCMVNCKKYNSMPGGALYQKDGSIPYEHIAPYEIYDAPADLSSKTLNIIKAHKNDTLTSPESSLSEYSFIKMHCLHCVDPACVSVCPVGALQKNPENGVVSYDKNKCFGCRYCQVACPFGIPKFEWHEAKPEIRKCQLCQHRFSSGGYSACCEFCPTGASIFGRVIDLQQEAKLRLGLTPGSYYKYPIQTVTSSQRIPQKVAGYYNHIYGLNESGGTQYLLMAGVPFDRLGLNPRITDQAYPDLTWSYITKVPWLIAGLLVAGTVTQYLTRKNTMQGRDKNI